MIAGKFTKNSIKILGFREKSYIKWKYQLHNKIGLITANKIFFKIQNSFCHLDKIQNQNTKLEKKLKLNCSNKKNTFIDYANSILLFHLKRTKKMKLKCKSNKKQKLNKI